MFVNIWGKNIWYDIYGAEHSDTLLYLHGGPGPFLYPQNFPHFLDHFDLIFHAVAFVFGDPIGAQHAQLIEL